jgi:hypothetical protein
MALLQRPRVVDLRTAAQAGEEKDRCLSGAVREAAPQTVAIGKSVYCFNFAAMRSTASFTSPPALSI